MSKPTERPARLTFTPYNEDLRVEAVSWVRVPDSLSCEKCRSRGGWQPRVFASNCPACWGEDPYGEPSFCGECEYCCGC